MISTYAFKDLMTLPQTLHLRGVCPQFGTFTLNFIDEAGKNLLHFSFRIDQQTLVINDKPADVWGKATKIEDVSFPKGRPFVISLEIAEENAVRVFLDEELLSEFDWRTDIRCASRLDLTDVDFALVREGDTFKTLPDGMAPSGSSENAEAALRDVQMRLDHLTARVGDIADAVAKIAKRNQSLAADVKALLSRESIASGTISATDERRRKAG